ncbi:recombinase family protein [Asaccharospora irregularis]|uniref:Site-specific DNA recombinase n=1 Tax=Asaccharospora irregularis DSM 2635 TaxID=1121321 RepID=A0A1M5RGL4_9FIRM|nr:recombinase family protein [Asaccharospora irregularis]SHH25381.1 Site-specific DNA recombinase [Asaccharospora irregularis DSM 2635]
MKVGYVRVSDPISQNPQRQIEMMEERGVEKIFLDRCSGKDIERPELKNMLSFIRENDEIIVESFSRLARSVKNLLELVEFITEKKKASLISIKESIDTNTPAGKMMLTIIGSISQFEREVLLERQREGIAIARKNNKYKGRKKIDYPNNWDEVYNKYKTREITGNTAMELLNLKRTTFYKLKKEYESKGDSNGEH